MMKKLIGPIGLVGLIGPLTALAAATCRSEIGGHCVNLASTNYAQIENFLKDATPGNLIPTLFTFGLGLVGLSALIVLVFGGFMYMTARDSADQIKRAQGYMTNAVFGLVLALLSWLILFTINPDLVGGWSVKLPKLTPPPKIEQKVAPPGGDALPNQGFVKPGAAQPTTQNTCNQFHANIDGLCFGYITNPPCSPPEFYTYVAGSCHLKCNKRQVESGTCPLKTK